MRRNIIFSIFALFTMSCATVQFSQKDGEIRRGAGTFTFTDQQGNPNKPMTVWYYQPAGASPDMPIMFVMHGAQRDAQRCRDEWIPSADGHGFLLIVPEFSHKYYPGNREYTEGNMFDKKGNSIPEGERGFSVIEHLFDFVKEMTRNQSMSYIIYGHAAGGRFVQRMVLFKKDTRFRVAVAANPGIFVVPVYSENYPYGIRNSGMVPEDLRVAFNKNFVLLLGDRDVFEDDWVQSNKSEILEQGENRFERGMNFFESAKNEASKLGMIFNWKRTIISGAGHEDAQLAETAAQIFFIDDKN